eukprot:jgi/Galph1/3652/GphlegSOOS_G2365.1
MGRIFKSYLSCPVIYCCNKCHCHLAKETDLISKQFQGRHGHAYLFAEVVNVYIGPKEERVLITGLHVVADLFCNVCQSTLGWKYLEAYEETQKYKENRYIIELAKVIEQRSFQD